MLEFFLVVFSINAVFFIKVSFISGVQTLPKNLTVAVYGISKLPFLQSLPFIGPGFDLAVRDVNKDFAGTLQFTRKYLTSPSITNCLELGANYNLVADYYYAQRRENETVALFFAGCDDSTTIPVFGAEWNVLTILTGTTFSNVRSRQYYPTTIALGSLQYQSYASLTEQILIKYNWTSSAMIYDLSPVAPFFAVIANYILKSTRLRATLDLQMYSFPVDSSGLVDYAKTLQEISRHSRIVFLSIPADVIRQFMASAVQMNLIKTKEFVWISLERPQALFGQMKWTPKDDNAATLEWFRSFYVINTCYEHRSGLSSLLAEMRTSAIKDYNVPLQNISGIYPSEFTLTAYAAVQILAQVMNESLTEAGDIADGKRLSQRVIDRTFHMDKIGDMYIDGSGERQNRMCLTGFQSDSKTFETVQYYEGRELVNTSLSMNWQTPNRKPPPNEPVCGFRSDNFQCLTPKGNIFISVITPAGLAVVLIAAVVAAYVKWQPRDAITWWLMDNERLRLAKSWNFSSFGDRAFISEPYRV